MSRAVIFDLDGTLVDSAPDIHAAANRLMQHLGFEPFTLSEIRGFIGRGVPHLLACCLAARGAQERPGLLAAAQTAFLRDYEDAVTLTAAFPGVAEALSRLGAMGIRLGICTNKPLAPARSILAHLGLLGHFPVVIGGDSFSMLKPDPLPLRAAIEALGAAHALFVGDSEIDAETAARTGLPFALFTEGYRKSPLSDLRHSGVFSDFRMLPDLVTELLP